MIWFLHGYDAVQHQSIIIIHLLAVVIIYKHCPLYFSPSLIMCILFMKFDFAEIHNSLLHQLLKNNIFSTTSTPVFT